MRKLLTALSLATLLGGMATPALANENEFFGTLGGAGLGGYFGSMIGRGDGRLAATGAGVLLGGVLGNHIGRGYGRSDYDDFDHHEHRRHYGYAAPVYEQQSYYYAAPTRYVPTYVAPPEPEPTIYVNQNNGYCREYSQQVQIGNRVQESYGTACLQPDGSWKVVQ